jgi:hypothetical protein
VCLASASSFSATEIATRHTLVAAGPRSAGVTERAPSHPPPRWHTPRTKVFHPLHPCTCCGWTCCNHTNDKCPLTTSRLTAQPRAVHLHFMIKASINQFLFILIPLLLSTTGRHTSPVSGWGLALPWLCREMRYAEETTDAGCLFGCFLSVENSTGIHSTC